MNISYNKKNPNPNNNPNNEKFIIILGLCMIFLFLLPQTGNILIITGILLFLMFYFFIDNL